MEPRDTHCQKCGAVPGAPCRAEAGSLAATHTVRADHARYGIDALPLPGVERKEHERAS